MEYDGAVKKIIGELTILLKSNNELSNWGKTASYIIYG